MRQSKDVQPNKHLVSVMQYEIHEIEQTWGGICYDLLAELEFPVRRVYYIYGAEKDVQRGFHAHKKLRQLLFCPYGSIRITLDDGHERQSILLDKPGKILQVEPCLWREMEWLVTDSVLCVMASEYYDENDYIRDYAEFLQYTAEGGDNRAIQDGTDQDEPSRRPVDGGTVGI